jgi:hypothetical protein
VTSKPDVVINFSDQYRNAPALLNVPKVGDGESRSHESPGLDRNGALMDR